MWSLNGVRPEQSDHPLPTFPDAFGWFQSFVFRCYSYVLLWILLSTRQYWFQYWFGTARPWWSHQMETFSALLTFCAGNSPVTGEFPAQRPVTRSFDVFFDLCLNRQLSKQLRRWWFETPSRSLWRHCNATMFPWKPGKYETGSRPSWYCST